jgi:dephospho-CoA kinase
MLKVGLTGGIASGKSFVGRVLEELGCRLLRADEVGHAVLAPDGEAYGAVVAEFGGGILRDDGAIDRKKLGAIVFADPARLTVLNSVVHPAVFQRELDWLTAIERNEPEAIAVIEAAIMIESGSYRRYDRIVIAVCSKEQQIERAMSRDGITREQVEQRLARQMPLEEKIRYADYIVDTSGSKEATRKQTETVYRSLRSLKK